MRIGCVFIAVFVALLLATRTKPPPPATEPLAVKRRVDERIRSIEPIVDPGGDSDSIALQIAAWAKQDPQSAATWAKDVSDEPSRRRLIIEIATTWADDDPIAAAKYLLESIPPGQDQENAALGIVQRLAARDLAAAQEWVDRFPEGARERANTELNRIRQRQLVLVHE